MVRSSEPSWWDHCFHLSASFPSGSHSPPMDVKEVGSLGKELRANWLPGTNKAWVRVEGNLPPVLVYSLLPTASSRLSPSHAPGESPRSKVQGWQPAAK